MVKLAQLDHAETSHLDRELNMTKKAVFLGKEAAFLGSLLCNIPVVWTRELPTAAINGTTLYWNPDWFLQIPEKTRQTVLLHELWHVGFLHLVRCGTRDPEIWNYACDIAINNMLEEQGYSFEGTEPWLDRQYDHWSAENIYTELMNQAKEPPPTGSFGVPGDAGDMLPAEGEEQLQQQVQLVQQAHVTAQLIGGNGDGCGSAEMDEIETILRKFYAPKIDWASILQEFITEKTNTDRTWLKRNRRYPDIFMPGKGGEGRLTHLLFVNDTSGSITNEMSIRFNSEVKFVKEFHNPELLTLMQFDERITDIRIYGEDDPFDAVPVIGGRGTDLTEVYKWIIKERPVAAVIFSDLQCAPMPEVKGTPILWICINNPNAQVKSGKIIHIQE